MWPYWLMFLIPLGGVAGQLETTGRKFLWFIALSIMALLIGFRHEVGGDWFNYLRHFDNILYLSFSETLARSDPAYYAINWLFANAGWSIIWVNLVCALALIFGLNAFCRVQPLPWLALLVATPYLIIVVSMGYSRQSAALGFVLLGLAALGRQQTRKFVFFVLIGALFHKSAVIILPIAALAATQRRIWTFFWVSVVSLVGAYALVAGDVDTLWDSYVVSEYASASQGAFIRVMMNTVPSLLLLLFRNRIFYDSGERKLWLWMAVFSLACILGLSYSATAIDRIALYFIPLQLFAFSRIPFLTKNQSTFNLIIFAVVAYYALVMFVWMNFGANARYWLPYKSYIFS
jgi:hypothetical protein